MPNGSEKLRIAHDLHDGVVQDLAALGYAIDSVIGSPLLDPKLRSELREIRLESSRITSAVRNEVLQLLEAGENLSTLIARKFAKTGIEFILPEPLPEFSLPIKYEIRKIILEIVNNCISHANASKFSITLKEINSSLEIRLEDNGDGGLTVKPNHLGISGIKRRAKVIGATIEICEKADGVAYLLLIPGF